MRIFEVTDVEQHIDESELATLALNGIRKQIRDNPDKKAYFIRDLDPSLDKLRFTLYPFGKYPEEGKMETSNFDPFINIKIGVPKKRVLDFVMGQQFESVFRHEFQHYIDEIEKRFKTRDDMRRPTKKTEYINSNVEYPAWFKQQAEPMLAILRAARSGKSLDNMEKIEPDFKEFIRGGQHAKFTISGAQQIQKFNKKTRLRYLKDLAAVHKAVVAVEGATEKYRPQLMVKIAVWVYNRLGIKL